MPVVVKRTRNGMSHYLESSVAWCYAPASARTFATVDAAKDAIEKNALMQRIGDAYKVEYLDAATEILTYQSWNGVCSTCRGGVHDQCRVPSTCRCPECGLAGGA